MVEINSDKLLKARVSAGLNVTEVERKTGISRATIYRLEQSRVTKTRASTLHKIAECYEVDVTDLIK